VFVARRSKERADEAANPSRMSEPVGRSFWDAAPARHLIRYWDGDRIVSGQPTHAALGTSLVDGVGRTAPTRAGVFQDLGIPALLFCDNDDPAVDADVAAVSARGVSVVRWQRATRQRPKSR
jgi:hypothetical protein